MNKSDPQRGLLRDKEIDSMKRITLVLGLVAVMAAMMVALAAPAMAKDNNRQENRVDNRLDHRVDRLENRFDNQRDFLVEDVGFSPFFVNDGCSPGAPDNLFIPGCVFTGDLFNDGVDLNSGFVSDFDHSFVENVNDIDNGFISDFDTDHNHNTSDSNHNGNGNGHHNGGGGQKGNGR
jgi:hypothetical protein